jgi:putative flippase GtrA
LHIRTQFIRYATVGLVANLALYLGYLGLTAIGAGPKSAMTVMYAAGIVVTFVFNRRWSFRHEGVRTASFFRYLVAYASFYAVNYAGLWVFVDQAGWPHQWVQAAMILVCAAGLFITQRLWVFPASVEAGSRP